jgi:hypothetical protein
MLYSLQEAAMTERAVLIREIETLPESRVAEALDFVGYLKQRSAPRVPETMLLSEAAPAKDWGAPEEDEAWAGL